MKRRRRLLASHEETEKDVQEVNVSWIQKRVTPEVVSANRANSKKSTGPLSKTGKRRVGRNAGKYYVSGQITATRMRELGEDPAEFEALRQSLRKAIRPRDGFEEILVDEMAVNRWRLARLGRAETGMLAKEREMAKIRIRNPLIQRNALTNNLIMGCWGLAGVADSRQKYEQILDLLASLDSKVQKEGFTPEGLKLLRTVYGESPSLSGASLIRQFDAQLQSLKHMATITDSERQEGDAIKERQAALAKFLTSLREEIETCALYLEVQVRLMSAPIPDWFNDSLLILSDKDSERIIRYWGAPHFLIHFEG